MPDIPLTHTVDDIGAAALNAVATRANVTVTNLLLKVLADFTARAIDDYDDALLERVRAVWQVATIEQKKLLINTLVGIESP